jgi:hypothetical protein
MRQTVTALLLFALIATAASAMYEPHDLEQVPVDRLVANLEIMAKERPKDVWVRVNIWARAWNGLRAEGRIPSGNARTKRGRFLAAVDEAGRS